MDRERSRVQDIILNIFKIIAELCERENLRYYAIGGTCLGAVRHQGFIPWDDDLDIAMPVEDLRKFIDLAPKYFPDYIELFLPSTSKHDYLLFVKVMDIRTMMTENTFIGYKDSYEGVWVDIMPLSGVPSDKVQRGKFIKKAENFGRLTYRIKTKFPIDGSFYQKVYWCVVFPLRILPQDYLWKKWIKWLLSYPFDACEFTGYVWARKLPELVFPKALFDDFVYLNFEDTKIRCPIGYHEFLKQMFGNYMEYPPEEQRTSGHCFDRGCIDLDHSYKEYQSGKLSFDKEDLNE